ncbi:hypothetical protein AB0I81_56195 [Nonomuraea sp. NPDC050404]|uniref:DUF7824 domain-containing protein n=1 Tax=Nonomuraea sp. NPDC050404 TaxID=3155783 RepID=UPI003411373B
MIAGAERDTPGPGLGPAWATGMGAGPTRDAAGAEVGDAGDSAGAGVGGAGVSVSAVWEAVVAAIDSGDPELVAECVLGLDERARRAVAGALPGHVVVAEKRAQARTQERVARRDRANEAAWQEYVRAGARAGRTVYDHERWRWDAPWNRPVHTGRDESWAGAMRVAGAVAIGGAAAVAAWLSRRDLQHRSDDGTWAVLERVLAARPAAWQADFAVRAARRLRPVPRRRGGQDGMATLVLSMLRRTGAVPPRHDPLVVAWAARTPVAAELREDPLLDHLLPRLFEAEGVGRVLRTERADPLPVLPGVYDQRPERATPPPALPGVDDQCPEEAISPPTLPGVDDQRSEPATSPPALPDLRDELVQPLPALPGVHERPAEGERVRTWLAALTTLEREGRIGRDLLLNGCLRRFMRGGEPTDLRFFLRLHELLDPAHDEVSERRRDYLRLLPAGPGAVAEPALRQVRRLADLDPADVTEALRALLSRSERKLLTAGLTWLDEVAGDPATDLGPLAPALGYAFACESADVQGRAVRVAVKHAKRFTGDGAQAVRDAIGVLPQGLAETLAAVFGAETGEVPGESDGFTPVPLPEPAPVKAFPAPVVAARELDGPPTGARWEAAELWLAGVVRLYSRDRGGLVSRLTSRPIDRHQDGDSPPAGRLVSGPAERRQDGDSRLVSRPIDRRQSGDSPPAGRWLEVSQWAQEIVRLMAGRTGGRGDSRLPEAGEVPGPHLFLLRRWAEVCDAIEAGTLPPYLLAEPTNMTGHLDARELVERLAGYERAGAEAMPTDLRQALLRLPREIPAEVVARAGRLTSGAGRAAACWMSGARPEPVAEISWWYCPPEGTPGTGDSRLYGDDRESPGPGSVLYELTPHLRTTNPAAGEPPGGAVGHRLGEHSGLMHWWPYLLPSDRETVAAHLVPHLIERWQRARAEPYQAEALARAGGPPGEAVALVLAYFAADRSRSADPAGRARPLVELAARGELDAEQMGRQFALLVRRTELKPGPVFETLESAAVLGAHQEVWRIMAGFLAVFLPAPGERSHTRHTQGLVFALRAARWARARGAVPCVAEIARRRASNNFVREARRLHTYLT